MSVFDEVPENSVFITQPHLRKDQTRPTNALPSMLVFPTKHINILENWRRALLANMMPFTVQSSSNEATDSFASVLSNTCAEMGIQVHSTAPQHHSTTAQHSTAQHSTAQQSTAQHNTAQHSTAQHSTAQQHSTGCVSLCHLCVVWFRATS